MITWECLILPESMKTSSSNGGGGGGFSMDSVDPELINAAISTTGTLIGMVGSKKTETERTIKNVCGRRPILRKNRAQYTACANQVLQNLMGGFGGGRAGNTWGNQGNQGGNWGQPPRQGMSTGAVIGIVGGVVALGAIVVLVSRQKS